jgi:hypothetical protein
MSISALVDQSLSSVTSSTGVSDQYVNVQSGSPGGTQVSDAYAKYQAAKQIRQSLEESLSLIDNPQSLISGEVEAALKALQTALEKESTALMVYQYAVEKNGDLVLENGNLSEESSLAAGSQKALAFGDRVFASAQGGTDSLGFVEKVYNYLDADMKVREKAVAKLSALNKHMADLRSAILKATTPLNDGTTRIDFASLDSNEITHILDTFCSANDKSMGTPLKTTTATGPEGLKEAETWLQNHEPDDAPTRIIVRLEDGRYQIKTDGGRLFTSSKTGGDGLTEANKWATEKFGLNSATTVTEVLVAGKIHYAVSLDLAQVKALQQLFIDTDKKQSAKPPVPGPEDAKALNANDLNVFNSALDAQQKNFEAGVNKAVQLTVQGREQLYAVVKSLSALISNVKDMLQKLVSGL